MIVVFDTNIWLQELGLQTSAGAATRFFLKQTGARLAIPEVVRLEVERNLYTTLSDHVETIQNRHRQLLTAFGTLKQVVLPTEAEINQRVQQILGSLDVPTLELQFTIESARNAFLKTISKAPPCDKTQEFKDAVIWEDCLKLLEQCAVKLVTSDKAFFEARTYDKGLSKNLQDEMADKPHKLEIISSLSGLLSSIRKSVKLDEESLLTQYFSQFRGEIDRLLTHSGFSLGERRFMNYSLYATENPTCQFLEFEAVFACEDARHEQRTDAELRIAGDGSYNTSSQNFTELRNLKEEVTFVAADGSQNETKNITLRSAGSTQGHRDVQHQIRYRIDEAVR